MKIRHARLDDTATLVALGEQMHAESPRFSRCVFVREKCEAFTRDVLESSCGIVLLAEHGGETVGMFAGAVTEHFFSHDRMAVDFAVYVAPRHRGGSAFVRLLHAFEEQAKLMGASEVVLGISTGVNVVRTASAYRRSGYSDTGVSMRKVLRNV